MTLLIALALLVHGGVHIGYPCGRAWPFAAADPWPVALLGMNPDGVQDAGIALAVVAFLAFLLTALAATGLLPSPVWRPIVLSAVAASVAMLVVFLTPWTVPGIGLDLVLAWAVLVRGWRPAPLLGARKAAVETGVISPQGSRR